MVSLQIPQRVFREVGRELTRQRKVAERLIPRAVNASAKAARTRAVKELRGLGFVRLGSARKGRIRLGRRATAADPNTRLWFGADPVPAERVRGNLPRGLRAGRRGISTSREGRIPRSFAVRTRTGRILAVRRFGRRRGQYSRITTDIRPEFSKARADAADYAIEAFPAEYQKLLEKQK